MSGGKRKAKVSKENRLALAAEASNQNVRTQNITQKQASPKTYKVCGLIAIIVSVFAILAGLLTLSAGGLVLLAFGIFLLIVGIKYIKKSKVYNDKDYGEA